MTVVPADIKAGMRQVYDELIHNEVRRVKKILSYTTVTSNPNYRANSVPTLATYRGLRCSIFHVLSGKTNRIFGDRDPAEVIRELGLVDYECKVIQYVCEQDLTPEVISNPTLKNNLLVGEEVELAMNDWWRVIRVVPDSVGIQHTVFLTK